MVEDALGATADTLVVHSPDVTPQQVPPQDAGIVFPAVCLYRGTPCTDPYGRQDDCLPRQDPPLAVWSWGTQVAEAKMVNCSLSPFHFSGVIEGLEHLTTPLSMATKVTVLKAVDGVDCLEGAEVLPGKSCSFRARFDFACKPDAGQCTLSIPTWRSVGYEINGVGAMVFFKFGPG